MATELIFSTNSDINWLFDALPQRHGTQMFQLMALRVDLNIAKGDAT